MASTTQSSREDRGSTCGADGARVGPQGRAPSQAAQPPVNAPPAVDPVQARLERLEKEPRSCPRL